MFNKIISIFNRESSGLHEAAFLLGFFALASQVLALFRDRILAHTFGASSALDVYYASFRVPDFLYLSIASLVSLTVLIPFLSQRLSKDGEASRKEAQVFLSSVFSMFMFVMVGVSIVIFFLMPILSPVVAPGFNASQLAELTLLSRIMLLSPILLGISNLLGSVTQLFKRFFVYALSPLFYNIGIISGIIFFYPLFGLPGLAVGVILGALMHMLIQIPVVMKTGLFPRFSLKINMKAVREVITTSLPRTIALSSSNLSIIVLVALSSTIYQGAVSIFNFSFNLQSVPLSIIGVSYSLAAFPTLAGLFSRGERDRFADHIVEALRHIIFWSLPVMALFIVLRAQVVRVILGSGSFSWSDTRLTAAALAVFSLSILAQAVALLLVRGFYAAGETRIPLFVNIGASVVTIMLAFGLGYVFEHSSVFRNTIESLLRVRDMPGTGILMLPLAYSLGMIGNALSLWVFFERRHVSSIPRSLSRTSFEGFVSAVGIGFATYYLLNIFGRFFSMDTFWGIFLQGFSAGVLGIVFGIVILRMLKSKELDDIGSALNKRLWKAEVIAPEMRE
ncbi:MAG: lipid II flippase MurJ, partial [Candidatus Paceibacterota bacterium]